MKKLRAPLERNMYMEKPCQQMCNGHEHVCLEVNVTLFFVYRSLGMALIMTGAHGWSWWWLQKRTLLGEKPLVVAWCRGLHLDQEPEAVLHLETQYGLVFQSWNLQKKKETKTGVAILASYRTHCSLMVDALWPRDYNGSPDTTAPRYL